MLALLKSDWHLCSSCRDSDWEQDPVAATKNRLEQEKPVEYRHHCGHPKCSQIPEHVYFFLCRYHAVKARLCQRCSKTTRSQEEQEELACLEAEQEIFEQAVDFFTLLVKSYNIKTARNLVEIHSSIWDPAILSKLLKKCGLVDPANLLYQEIVGRALNYLDSRYQWRNRLVWERVLGPNCYGRYCENCLPPSPKHPAISYAEECKHLIVGEKAKWCALYACANKLFVCEICGVSIKY